MSYRKTPKVKKSKKLKSQVKSQEIDTTEVRENLDKLSCHWGIRCVRKKKNTVISLDRSKRWAEVDHR